MSGVIKLCGFEFRISEGQESRWVRIQGPGGLLGDGCLTTLKTPEQIGKLEARLLRRARVQLEDDGEILILRSWHVPSEERYVIVRPDAVEEARAMPAVTNAEVRDQLEAGRARALDFERWWVAMLGRPPGLEEGALFQAAASAYDLGKSLALFRERFVLANAFVQGLCGDTPPGELDHVELVTLEPEAGDDCAGEWLLCAWCDGEWRPDAHEAHEEGCPIPELRTLRRLLYAPAQELR